MRVTLKRSGGFAATTHLHPVVVDTTRVSPEQAARLDRRVAAARSSRAWRSTSPPPLGADLVHYSLTITEDRRGAANSPASESVEFDDPVQDPSLIGLVDIVLELGEVQS